MADGVPFGNYRLLKRIARGGMAEVFLALHVGVEGFERRVAIKRILPHLSESPEFRVMFNDEARLAAQLTHPNIVHIYDFGKVEDYYYIAMEYVNGVDLGRVIKRAKKQEVPFEIAARIFSDVCSGLNYAHHVADPQSGAKLNLVHRDVTPQNILVTYDGVVKVVDFGIAKAAWSAAQTRPGVVKGKFAYMSPEQVEGRSLDCRSDVFSVAICLHEMLTGEPLFRRDDVTAAMREIRDGKSLELTMTRAGVPESLLAILRHGLARPKDQRYATAAAMQLDLEKYLKDQSVIATSTLVGDFLRREHPPEPDEESPTGTQPNPAGTERQGRAKTGGGGASGTGAVSNPASVSVPLSGTAPLTGAEPTPQSAIPTRTTPAPENRPTLPLAIMTDDEADDLDDTLPARRGDRPAARMETPAGAALTAMVPAFKLSRSRVLASAALAGTLVALAVLLVLHPWSRVHPADIDPEVAPESSQSPTPSPTPSPSPSPTPKPNQSPSPRLRPSPSPSPSPSLDPSPSASPLPATLDILSRPAGAHVSLDGRDLPDATPLRNQSVPHGRHRVLVEHKGFLPLSLSLSVARGEHRTIDVELRPGPRVHPRARANGFLTVKTVPWSNVFEGSRKLGTTPLANVPLGEGAHALTFVNPELPPLHKTVTVRAGEEARLSFELKP